MTIQSDFLFSIKHDDISKFKELLENKRSLLSLSYGRFPVLSLCYLYKSKKIIKNFENELFSVKNYNIVEEDLQTYRLFKNLSGKCLRFFIDKIVTPYDMLAVLGESLHIISLKKKFEIESRVLDRVISIFSILHSQKVTKSDEKIYISKKSLSSRQKAYAIITLAVVMFVMLFSGGAWFGYERIFGNGSVNRPYRIAGENQLIEAMSRGEGNFYLADDITLTKPWSPEDFSGHLDGREQTIFASDKIMSGFIDTLDGRVENLNFDMSYSDIEVEGNIGLLANLNNSQINNINMKVKGNFIAKDTDENMYFSCLTTQNDGDIFDSELDADITFENSGNQDSALSGIASINNGKIERCSTTDTSKFITDTVDVSGLVVENYGQVKECVNNAQVTQTTSAENWFPNASGLVMINNGEVENCENYGDITVETQAEDSRYEAYAGGIVCINNNSVIKSKNNSHISATSNTAYIYAGGVVAFNAGQNSLVESSCSYGNISISSSDEENFLFAGGISAYSEGAVIDSFSISTLESEHNQAILGGIMGIVNYYTAQADNNYYLARENIDFGAGNILQGNQLIGGSDRGVTVVQSYEELKENEVYWS
ncbi:MAG: hypothetical protein ACOCWI_04525 [Bacillota bacterium]